MIKLNIKLKLIILGIIKNSPNEPTSNKLLKNPSPEELKEDIKKLTKADIAKKYNMSSQNIGYRLKQYRNNGLLNNSCKCRGCGTKIPITSIECNKCRGKGIMEKNKGKRPSVNELKELLKSNTRTEIAKKFNVSFCSVRNWIDTYKKHDMWENEKMEKNKKQESKRIGKPPNPNKPPEQIEEDLKTINKTEMQKNIMCRIVQS